MAQNDASLDGVLTDYLKNSAGPLAAGIAGGDFSDEEINKFKQHIEKMVAKRSARKEEDAQEPAAAPTKKPQQPQRFADPASGTNYFTPQFANLSQLPKGFGAFQPEPIPPSQPEKFPAHFKVNPYTGETLTDDQKLPEQQKLEPDTVKPLPQTPPSTTQRTIPQTPPVPKNAKLPPVSAPQPRGSQPNKSTIQATLQPPPRVLQGQPTTEEERARQFQQRQEEDRMNPTETIDEQIDQDEDTQDIASLEEEDENENFKQIARQEKRKLEQKLKKKRFEKKQARELTLMTLPFSLGMISGGMVIISFLITFPIGLLIAFAGAMGALFSLFIYTYNAPLRALHHNEKTPTSLKANRPAISLFQREAKKAIARHNYEVMADMPLEIQKRTLFHAIFQPMGVFFATASGIIILVVIFMGMIVGVCEGDWEADAAVVAAKSACAVGGAVSTVVGAVGDAAGAVYDAL